MNKRLVLFVVGSVMAVAIIGIGITLALRDTPETRKDTSTLSVQPTPSPVYPDLAVAPENLQLARNAYDNCLVTGAQLLSSELHYRLPDACRADALLQAGELDFVAAEPGYGAGGALDAETGRLRVYVRLEHQGVAEAWAEQFNGAVLIVTTGKP